MCTKYVRLLPNHRAPIDPNYYYFPLAAGVLHMCEIDFLHGIYIPQSPRRCSTIIITAVCRTVFISLHLHTHAHGPSSRCGLRSRKKRTQPHSCRYAVCKVLGFIFIYRRHRWSNCYLQCASCERWAHTHTHKRHEAIYTFIVIVNVMLNKIYALAPNQSDFNPRGDGRCHRKNISHTRIRFRYPSFSLIEIH